MVEKWLPKLSLCFFQGKRVLYNRKHNNIASLAILSRWKTSRPQALNSLRLSVNIKLQILALLDVYSGSWWILKVVGEKCCILM